MAGSSIQLHGTCVALGETCALLTGEPGSGKSDLALRFLSMFATADGTGAALIADDQTIVSREKDSLVACAPEATAGLIEVRGIGIIEAASRPQARLALIVELTNQDEIERLPDALSPTTLLDVEVSRIKLEPFEASAPIKLKIALTGRL